MSAEIKILAIKIQDELDDVERVVNRTHTIYRQALVLNNDAYFDALALNLHDFYTGVEHIFKDIARTVEKHIPSSEKWHRELLQQMALEISSIRPPVIQKKTSLCLDEYLHFRHVVRHEYTFNLRTDRVEKLGRDLRDCFTAVNQDLQDFIQFLQQLANE